MSNREQSVESFCQSVWPDRPSHESLSSKAIAFNTLHITLLAACPGLHRIVIPHGRRNAPAKHPDELHQEPLALLAPGHEELLGALHSHHPGYLLHHLVHGSRHDDV